MAETVEPVLSRPARHGSLRRQVLGLFAATVLVLLVFGLGAVQVGLAGLALTLTAMMAGVSAPVTRISSSSKP